MEVGWIPDEAVMNSSAFPEKLPRFVLCEKCGAVGHHGKFWQVQSCHVSGKQTSSYGFVYVWPLEIAINWHSSASYLIKYFWNDCYYLVLQTATKMVTTASTDTFHDSFVTCECPLVVSLDFITIKCASKFSVWTRQQIANMTLIRENDSFEPVIFLMTSRFESLWWTVMNGSWDKNLNKHLLTKQRF